MFPTTSQSSPHVFTSFSTIPRDTYRPDWNHKKIIENIQFSSLAHIKGHHHFSDHPEKFQGRTFNDTPRKYRERKRFKLPYKWKIHRVRLFSWKKRLTLASCYTGAKRWRPKRHLLKRWWIFDILNFHNIGASASSAHHPLKPAGG